MRYREITPAGPLAGLVKCYWSLESEGVSMAGEAEPVVPDGCPEVVFNLSDRFRRMQTSGQVETQPATIIAGQMRRRIVITPTGAVDLFGVRFRPAGARPLIRLPLGELTDRIEDIATIFGRRGRELEERINLAGSFEARIAIIDAEFTRAVAAEDPSDPIIEKAVAMIIRSAGAVSVKRLTCQLGTSERRLERMFKDRVGLLPKMFSRIVRFQTVLRAIESGSSPKILDAALDHGYYDQSHLIRDFREFAGAPPVSYFDDTHRIAELFTSGS
jgi:AraC-like DNA-binding protein